MSTHAELRAIVEKHAAEWQTAKQQAIDAAEAYNAAKAMADVARRALDCAMVAADDVLPKATVHSGRGNSYKVAVVKCTPSTVLTRNIGTESEQAWRKSKYQPGHWHKYPKEKSCRWSSNPSYLIIDGDEPNDD